LNFKLTSVKRPVSPILTGLESVELGVR